MIMISTQPNSKTKQKGNATVETILIATVMAPLLGGIPLLGKIADINNTTTQSSRYLAWEQTIAGPSGKTAAQLETEVSNRFFAKPDLHIRTDRGALSEDEYDNPMWTGYGYNEEDEVNRLVTLGNGLTTHIVNEEPQSLAGRLSSGIERIGRTMARFSGGEWNIEAQGLYTATVSIDVASNKYLPSGVNCNHQESEDTTVCISRSNAIFVDSWEARNSDHAEARARTFVPAGALEDVGDTIAHIAGAVPFFADIATLESDGDGGFGYVNAEVLPLDRYADD
ncbi:MAG: hypothetical protein KZQ95_21955 [Candidatus Thiodiazotropha sp. (ex Epidulcina cf. delphinae)]|nr:hypothetical protein [Candidatus Thiodiazotropha sp. (ex Epidulcina cf. delphinae)]